MLLVGANRAEAQNPVLSDPKFAAELLYDGPGMVSLDFGPAGRLYVAEKTGRILTLEPDATGRFRAPEELANFVGTVDFEQESGLLGLAVDPDFENTRMMYLLYTTSSDQRIVRIEINTAFDRMVPGSETVILDGLPRYYPFHKAGDIQFHPQEPDVLYVSLGDDAAFMVTQDPDYFEGKILRIDKHTGLGLVDNPFHEGDVASIRSRVWAVGFRNPFRFIIHPDALANSSLYVSENGVNTDRYAWVGRGANGYWEGLDVTRFLNPPDPNFRILGTPSPFLCGIAIAAGGPFEDPDYPGSSVLYISNPQEMDGAGTIRRFRLTGPDLDTLVPLAVDEGRPFSVGVPGFDMAFGPDKALYLTQTTGGEASSPYHKLSRIRFVDSTVPEAKIIAPPVLTGETPFSVSFDEASTDFDGYIDRYFWSFGDGETSTERAPTHLYLVPGSFTATLNVWDNRGLTDTATIGIQAISTRSLQFSGQIYDGRELPERPLSVGTEVRIYHEDGVTPLELRGRPTNTATIAPGGVVDFTVATELRSRKLVYSIGENTPGFTAAVRGTLVAENAELHHERFEAHLSSSAIRGQIVDTRGEAALLDLGVSKETLGVLYPLAGGRDYLPTSSIAASGVAHRVVTDVLGYYYLPLRPEDAAPETRYILSLVGDTGAEYYLPRDVAVGLDQRPVQIRNLSVGLVRGGRSCDNLAAHTGQADRELYFEDHIQSLLENACIGCHDNTSENSGGLNLGAGAYLRLMLGSYQVPGLKLVEPGDPQRSYLFEKINCSDPQFGDRMRPTDRMPLAHQAMIYYWIQQGARERSPLVAVPDAGLSDSMPADAEVVQPEALEQPECSCRTAKSENFDVPWQWALYFLAAIVLRRGISIAARNKRG